MCCSFDISLNLPILCTTPKLLIILVIQMNIWLHSLRASPIHFTNTMCIHLSPQNHVIRFGYTSFDDILQTLFDVLIVYMIFLDFSVSISTVVVLDMHTYDHSIDRKLYWLSLVPIYRCYEEFHKFRSSYCAKHYSTLNNPKKKQI